VAFQNFEEVWAALGRLYTDIVRLQEAQQQLVELHTRSVSAHAEQMKQMAERIDKLVESQQLLVESQNRVNSMVMTVAGNVAQLASNGRVARAAARSG